MLVKGAQLTVGPDMPQLENSKASIAEWGGKCMHNLNYSYKLVQLAPHMTNSIIDLNEKNNWLQIPK